MTDFASEAAKAIEQERESCVPDDGCLTEYGKGMRQGLTNAAVLIRAAYSQHRDHRREEVFRFDADAYCIVFCLAGSNVVQMTSNLADERNAQMHAEAIRKKGGYVLRVCSAGTLVAALELIKRKSTGAR